ncbi:hypothetical protein ACS0TY_015164 [Phlomoides rotata]
MRTQPLARYHGGMVVKLDGVKARNFGHKELAEASFIYCGPVCKDNDGENSNLDDEDHENDGDGFSDSDYKMDEDVVAVEGDFDESKESDEELTGPRYPIFNPDVVFEPHFELGMIFSNMLDFKKVVQSHAIKAKRQDVIDELEVDVTNDQAYRARRLALKNLRDVQMLSLLNYGIMQMR